MITLKVVDQSHSIGPAIHSAIREGSTCRRAEREPPTTSSSVTPRQGLVEPTAVAAPWCRSPLIRTAFTLQRSGSQRHAKCINSPFRVETGRLHPSPAEPH